MKIKLHSQYNHFPNHTAAPGEPADLELWNDGKIWEYIEIARTIKDPRGSALLIEPRSLQPRTYELVENNFYLFKNIYTHDSQLLRELPNAHRMLYWNEYEIHDEPKTKDISMICGSKTMCPLHNLRQRLAERIQDKVDILGDWKGGSRCSIAEAYANYKFTVVIENYLDDYWFTEKILNAFASKTVPVYIGARRIGWWFNANGIIQVPNIWDTPDMLRKMQDIGLDYIYYSKMNEIEENFERVQQYKNFEDYFIKEFAEDKAP